MEIVPFVNRVAVACRSHRHPIIELYPIVHSIGCLWSQYATGTKAAGVNNSMATSTGLEVVFYLFLADIRQPLKQFSLFIFLINNRYLASRIDAVYRENKYRDASS